MKEVARNCRTIRGGNYAKKDPQKSPEVFLECTAEAPLRLAKNGEL